jgi:DNA-binding transcriptional LysR family regulator
MQWADRIGRRLKLRDVHVLLAVVESGSMVRAGKRLSVSQPVVSKAIADLEHTLGVRLLERSRKGIEVTPHGRALLHSGLAAFDELRRGVQEIEFLNDPTSGEVRIGATEPMTMGLLPVAIERVSRRHPRLTIDVVQANSTTALHQELRERTVDFVIGRVPPTPIGNDINVEVLFQDPSLVVASPQGISAKRRRVELAELADARWILPRIGTPARDLIADWFELHGIRLTRAAVVCNSIQLQVALIATGQFVSILPLSLTHFSARRLALKTLDVREPAPRGPVGILMLKNRVPAPGTRLLLDVIRNAARPLAVSTV